MLEKYLLNNVKQIKLYESYYKNKFDIDRIKNAIINKELKIELLDLYRFRIFLDSCVILFNKEKLEKDYFKDAFDPKNFITSIKGKYKCIIDYIEETFSIKVKDTFYYEFNKTESRFESKSLWNSRKILRNSFAHMQYGDFLSDKNGIILCYGIFNKDNDSIKSTGLVIEPLCHELIGKFYLNQVIKSVAYKHTCIIENLDKFQFVEVQYKGKSKYSVENNMHPMNNKIFSTRDYKTLEEFLKNHAEIFDTTYNPINNLELEGYKGILCEYLGRKHSSDELGYFIKSIYDIETEFSNFLTHLIQLNDRLIDYKLTVDFASKEYINKLFISIDELKEDSTSWLEFKWFFKILYIINFSLRLEDSDSNPVKYSDICIDNFSYDVQQMMEFVNKAILNNKIQVDEEKFGNVIYILSKIRNAVAHGKIKLEIGVDNKIYFVFEDNYHKKRKEQIKISIENMDKFSENISTLI